MSPTLSRYLKDFSAEPPPQSPGIPDMPFEETLDFPESPVAPSIDIEAERREAYAQGHEAATQELTQRHQAELDTIATTHRGEMEALRARYEERAAEKIAAGLRELATVLGQAISAEAAAALAPVMTEALTAKAVADLAERVTAAILDGAAGPITVSSPRHLFEMLHTHIGQNGVLLRHVEARDVDLTVTIGESVLVTRMSAWAASLKEILK
ncbi:hypothetical protein QD460_23920 [Rhizobium jaguaris]|uniref:Uncharacterized protein n=1 Tax=Rhizobium jaguaris TaxID=1312183 RepID=A0A387FHW5_9HYPH|nr:hypothetical protein [Rhizobium jaguaris]AYG58109.1 hypothetical protein CCGE525_04220 [Rhizobium jaguaris]